MEPNPLAIFGLCLAGAGGLVFLLWLNHKWATRGGAPVMSHSAPTSTSTRAAAGTIAGKAPEAGQGVAKPSTAVNDVLPGNALPEEVREIIRFQAKVEAVVDLIQSGEMGQTKAITIVFRCKASGREGSVYARARDAVQERLTPAPRYQELDQDSRPAELSQAPVK